MDNEHLEERICIMMESNGWDYETAYKHALICNEPIYDHIIKFNCDLLTGENDEQTRDF